MVTHNPELAHQYATRIVELADGSIVADSDPFVPTVEDQRTAKPARRTSMGFLTALSLSANNLMTKKGRTLMTSFAGPSASSASPPSWPWPAGRMPTSKRRKRKPLGPTR